MSAPKVSEAVLEGARHTRQEIDQQPALWRRVPGVIDAGSRDFVAHALADPDVQVVLAGAGTSAYAGEVLAPSLRRSLRRRVASVPTTDVVADPLGCFAQDVPTLLVSFARSGDSPESVAAAALADQLLTNVQHLVLTCNPDGQLARQYGTRTSAHVVHMPEGANDQGFAMTSSFTSMMLAAQLLLDPEGSDGLADRVAPVGERVLSAWDAAAQDLSGRGYRRVVYLGSGPFQGLAHESALKLLELTAGRVLALAGSSLGFRHGPKSVLDEDTLAVVYLSNDPHTRAYDLDLWHELRGSGGAERVMAISADHGDDASRATPWLLGDAAHLNDSALALPAVLFAQQFALHNSMRLGLTADNPFLGGEVNRVVQGVKIHDLDSSR